MIIVLHCHTPPSRIVLRPQPRRHSNPEVTSSSGRDEVIAVPYFDLLKYYSLANPVLSPHNFQRNMTSLKVFFCIALGLQAFTVCVATPSRNVLCKRVACHPATRIITLDIKHDDKHPCAC
jgi:hypothetical protein